MRTKLNAGGGDSKIVGFAKLKKMNVGDQIVGVYKGSFTTKSEYPKLNHIIELTQPLTFVSYDAKQKQDVTIEGNVGDAVAVESTSILASSINDTLKGRTLEITYKGVSDKKKPGQRPAYLADVYDITDEGSSAPQQKAAVGQNPVASAPAARSGFPFTKK
jgi:hypothetical protein